MNSTVSLSRKVKVLKRLETYAFQVAYYLLQDEELAIEAAQAVFLELVYNNDFFEKTSTFQREHLKKMTMKQSITTKQNNQEVHSI